MLECGVTNVVFFQEKKTLRLSTAVLEQMADSAMFVEGRLPREVYARFFEMLREQRIAAINGASVI